VGLLYFLHNGAAIYGGAIVPSKAYTETLEVDEPEAV
jgi:hypothetical protein